MTDDLFVGKRAVIVGGAGGIGLECAHQILLGGGHAVICDRAEPQPRNGIPYVYLDVHNDDLVRDACSDLAGRADVLIYTAGVQAAFSLLSYDDRETVLMFDVNVLGAMRVVKEFAYCWTRQRHETTRVPSIVLVASVAGVANGGRGLTAYAASKAALIQYGRCAARELAPTVRVNVVCPGWTDTGFNAPVEKFLGGVELHKELRRIPMRRTASTEEIAKVITFVASDAASYMVGSVIVADGGLSL